MNGDAHLRNAICSRLVARVQTLTETIAKLRAWTENDMVEAMNYRLDQLKVLTRVIEAVTADAIDANQAEAVVLAIADAHVIDAALYRRLAELFP